MSSGIIEAGDEGLILEEERPDDCHCVPSMKEEDLPCWPCYRAGFEIPNPNPEADNNE